MKRMVFFIACLMTVFPCWARIITVDDNGPADFSYIQDAINASRDSDVIILNPGIYVGDGNRDVDFLGKAITIRSIEPNDPNIVAETIIDCGGVWMDGHRGFFFRRGEDNNSVLDGLTIMNGLAWNENGGGILCQNSSPTIRNCIITDNSAEVHMIGGGSGGGIFCEACSPKIINCTITNNYCSFSGGGINILYGAPTISDCTISNNVSNVGGGISCYYDSTIITNCTISDNDASVQGGGVSLGQDSGTSMDNCVIKGNEGDGIYCEESSPMIHNCLIENNPRGINCSDHGNLLITNCTIARNYYGGGIYCYWSNPTITNSILWANSVTYYGPQITLRHTGWPSTLTVSFSDVEGGQAAAYVESGCTLNWGPGNIDADPCFANPYSGDYHLKSTAGRWDPNTETWVMDANTSPCIDAGDPNSDWKAELWPNGKRINMGAYGGTPQASMSLSTVGNIADLDNDDDLDYNDLKLFTEKWLYQEVLLAADLDRNGDVNFADFSIFGNEWYKENAEPGIAYQISGCVGGLSAVEELDTTRFTVTVNGRYVHFEDMMVANCCPDKLELAMAVHGDQIILYESEFLTYPCFCICDYPIKADLGPFKPGTYTLSVYEDYGGFIGSTTVIIE